MANLAALMHHFLYREGQLCCDDVGLNALADRHGTPLYVYSAATMREPAFHDLVDRLRLDLGEG